MSVNKKRMIVKSTSVGGRLSDSNQSRLKPEESRLKPEESRLKPEESRILELKGKLREAKTNKKKSLKGINPSILAALIKRRKERKTTGVVHVSSKPKGVVRRL